MSMHRGTGASLSQRPRRRGLAPKTQALEGQPVVPDGPGWYKNGTGVPHRVRFAMLDAETSRWTGMVESPILAATAHEFVVPRPANYVLPEPVVLAGSGCEASYRQSYSTRLERRRPIERSRRSTLVTPNVQGVLECFDDSEGYLPSGRFGTSTPEVNIIGAQASSLPSSAALNTSYRPHSHQEKFARQVAEKACNSSYQGRSIFPDIFYAHNPDRYHSYKDDCTAGYTDFSGFMRHSLNKHLRHLEQEGITPQAFEEARKVTPGVAGGDNKKEKRYLLAREKLFGTPQSVPIPFCEHGDSHPVIKGRIGRSKRRRSLDGSPSPEHPRVRTAPNSYNDNSGSAFAPGTGPALAHELQVSPTTNIPRQRPSLLTTAITQMEPTRRLLNMETEFKQWHHWLQQRMFEASGHFNMLDRALPGIVHTDEDIDRRKRLRNAFIMYASLANEFYSKLDDFGESQEFPGISQKLQARPEGSETGVVPSSRISLSGQSTSSGAWITPNASGSSLEIQHSQNGERV